MTISDQTDTLAPLLCSLPFAQSQTLCCLGKQERKVSESSDWSLPAGCSGGASPSLSSPDMGRISNPMPRARAVLKKHKAKPKRGLDSYTIATALSRYLLPFCSSQTSILVAATMTINHCLRSNPTPLLLRQWDYSVRISVVLPFSRDC